MAVTTVSPAHGRESGNSLVAGFDFYICAGQSLAELAVQTFVGYYHTMGPEFKGLLGQQFPIASGCESGHAEPVRVFPDYIKCLGADAAGTSKYCYLFHNFLFPCQSPQLFCPIYS